ncbi:uncharacterized protein PGTG_02958 [Puccinia graminis f. sp. tritici CRL 75-36-700-3]|uniref:Zn(2)-C6 fungal-type domain-containing protein n=1 Tax=Puccinia graminis f. sp. tritici (strain CRL 75-36-700-3 / race SCCL) TaxID=418459 RepID=E3JWU2_PUCGT|nr:uncharacterized protein PGTG_02958 [Puccinia graminis f. sp. tritici CRL 75-36-700-3]EFP76517.1 hypothetical protein PGTG_02958 [Puccinia graminis f. sp. tritici CRL 75-36-700-3]
MGRECARCVEKGHRCTWVQSYKASESSKKSQTCDRCIKDRKRCKAFVLSSDEIPSVHGSLNSSDSAKETTDGTQSPSLDSSPKAGSSNFLPRRSARNQPAEPTRQEAKEARPSGATHTHIPAPTARSYASKRPGEPLEQDQGRQKHPRQNRAQTSRAGPQAPEYQPVLSKPALAQVSRSIQPSDQLVAGPSKLAEKKQPPQGLTEHHKPRQHAPKDKPAPPETKHQSKIPKLKNPEPPPQQPAAMPLQPEAKKKSLQTRRPTPGPGRSSKVETLQPQAQQPLSRAYPPALHRRGTWHPVASKSSIPVRRPPAPASSPDTMPHFVPDFVPDLNWLAAPPELPHRYSVLRTRPRPSAAIKSPVAPQLQQLSPEPLPGTSPSPIPVRTRPRPSAAIKSPVAPQLQQLSPEPVPGTSPSPIPVRTRPRPSAAIKSPVAPQLKKLSPEPLPGTSPSPIPVRTRPRPSAATIFPVVPGPQPLAAEPQIKSSSSPSPLRTSRGPQSFATIIPRLSPPSPRRPATTSPTHSSPLLRFRGRPNPNPASPSRGSSPPKTRDATFSSSGQSSVPSRPVSQNPPRLETTMPRFSSPNHLNSNPENDRLRESPGFNQDFPQTGQARGVQRTSAFANRFTRPRSNDPAAGEVRRSHRAVLDSMVREAYERTRQILLSLFALYPAQSTDELEERISSLQLVYDEFGHLIESSYDALILD